MKKSFLLFCAIFLSSASYTFAQDSTAAAAQGIIRDTSSISLILPTQTNWNVLAEGQKLEFDVKASGGSGSYFNYAITQGKLEGMEFDSLGHFSWTPGYDFVDRLSSSKTIQLIFEAKNDKVQSITKPVEFKVSHVNRSPVADDLKPFYVRYNTLNTYVIDEAVVKDEDNDPVVFVPIPNAMPEGAKLTAQGEFTWKPSHTQFNQLKSQPLILEFFVEDQPAKARTKGKFKIEPTSQDIPPGIQMIPSGETARFKEDATINLKFQLSDPNGDNDIASFSFISDNINVPKEALVKNTASQYEFIWKPGYDFVKDPLDSLNFTLTFYVIDKSQKRDERKVAFTILNSVNEEEKDRKLYGEYRSSLVRAWDLMEQLKDTEKQLKKKYNRAKKGKKGRSIANASLGAVTGVAPVVVQPVPTSKMISTIGGTTVMTMGTLEATEVIGRSTKDLVERLNYIMEKKNELQTKGDIFARKYALRSSRRKPEFIKDVDDFVALMNLKGLVALELDAGWNNKVKATDENIVKIFKDFTPDQ